MSQLIMRCPYMVGKYKYITIFLLNFQNQHKFLFVYILKTQKTFFEQSRYHLSLKDFPKAGKRMESIISLNQLSHQCSRPGKNNNYVHMY